MSAETATVVVKKGRAKPLWFGHPWLYSEAIAKVDGAVAAGDEVRVVDDAGRFVGRGFISPGSQIRVRMAGAKDRPLDDTWLAARLEDAADVRARLGLPSKDTDAYRLVNGEGDFLPGLVVDVYGAVAVVQPSTGAMARRVDAIAAALAKRGFPNVVEVASTSFAKVEGFEPRSRVVRGDVPAVVACRELGIALEVETLGGQKTGAFLDQRENRALVGRLAKDARVLDLYSYAGGFGLAALAGGAKSVTFVDASARALDRVRRHLALNEKMVAGRPTELVEDDAVRYLERAPAAGFELIVCDPPKFARARKDVEGAIKAHRRLTTLALAACAEGGVLIAASCSQLVGEEELERVIAAAAHDARRTVRVLERRGAGPDHPVVPGFSEGRYLSVLVCRAG